MCQSSSNVLAYTADACLSGMSQQEDVAPHMDHTDQPCGLVVRVSDY